MDNDSVIFSFPPSPTDSTKGSTREILSYMVVAMGCKTRNYLFCPWMVPLRPILLFCFSALQMHGRTDRKAEEWTDIRKATLYKYINITSSEPGDKL